jgi:hypothetical protein
MGAFSTLKKILKEAAPDADFFISKADDAVRLDKLVIPEGKRNAGQGSAFMQALTQYADENNLNVVLTAAGDFGGSKAGQRRLYKRFGFVDNKGRAKDFRYQEGMIRQPSKGFADPALLALLGAGSAAAPTALEAFKGGGEALGKGIWNMIPGMAGDVLGQVGTATGADKPSMETLQAMLESGLGGLMGQAEASPQAQDIGQQMIMDAYRGIQDFGENTYTGRAGKQIYDWIAPYYGQLPERYKAILDIGL